MRKRRAFIPQRKPIFVGCEGQSEQGYAGFLQDLIHEAGLPIHLNIEVLGPGAGDPLSRIEMAISKLHTLRKNRAEFAERFVLLDTDQLALDRARADRAVRLAGENNIQIVWQSTCFEAVILRHFPGRAANRPTGNQAALKALLKEWPEYEKPMNRAQFAGKFDLEAVRRAAQVEPDLDAMLRCFDLLRG